MTTLALLLLIPVSLPWLFKYIWPHEITWGELGATMLITSLLVTAVYSAGIYGQMGDVQVLNGEVTSKQRIHDSYVRTYSCNCRQTCSGSGTNRTCSNTCDTCYEDRYTVKWMCNTNLDNYTIDSKDSSSRVVYLTPDPQRYTTINIGDPVSKTASYLNYVKAVPDSLFHLDPSSKFQQLIPEYPSEIFDIYRINRVLTPGLTLPDINLWNAQLSNLLKQLGPQKQANVVIVIANTSDQSYLKSLEAKWIGGKKNDIILVIGASSYPKIDWVGVLAWTNNELFKVQLRDEVYALAQVDREAVLKSIGSHVMKSYVRKPMEQYDYLADQIQPPLWVLILSFMLSILCTCALSWMFSRNHIKSSQSSSFRKVF